MRAQDFIIKDTIVKPGEEAQVNLNISRLPTGTLIDLPVFIKRGKKDGPVLLLLAGVHGDEVNGIEIVRRLLARNLELKAGTILAVPVLNIYGFLNFSRDVPDGKDVNRSFPGTKNGSLASMVAYHMMQDVFPHIDYGIDFHAGGDRRSNYPQIRCKTRFKFNKKLVEAFAPPFIFNAGYRVGSLRRISDKKRVPILVYEGGESLRFDEFAIEEAIQGTLRVMHYLGMVEESNLPSHPSVIIRKNNWIRANSSGLFRYYVENGTHVTKGQVLGTIADIYGKYENSVKSPANGWIIAVNNMPLINHGDALFHLGKER